MKKPLISFKTLFEDAKVYKSKIIYGQFIALIAVLATLPIPLLFPVLIDEVLLDKPAWLISLINTFYIPNELYMYVIVVFFTTIFLRLLYFGFNIYQSRLFIHVSKDIVYKLRVKLLEHLKHVSVGEYEALGGGGVGAKLVTDINTLDTFIGVSVAKFLVSILSLIGVGLVLVMINWQLAIILFILNPSVIAFTSFLGKKVRKLKKDENLKIESFQDALSETLDLFVQVRTYNQEERYIGKMIENARLIKLASSSFGWKSEAAAQVSSFVFLVGFEMIRATAMIMVLLTSLSIGEMFAVMGYLWFMVGPLQDFLAMVYSYQNATSALERLNAIFELEQEPQYEKKYNPFKDAHTNSITVKDLCFSYGNKQVLNNLNFEVKKGKTIALLGNSGSGKTTLAHVILGLYAAQKGDIFIDDKNIKEIGLDVVRENIALVLQTPRMFNDTLRQNLAFGKEIEDEKLYEVLEIAQLQSVIEKLEDGLETRIGKDGIRLSGGERQRLAIARMLVSNANIIILDESTSALDINTENFLFNGLRTYLKDKTILIIAHRLSTIEHADEVLYLKDGTIGERGTPSALMEKKGLYFDFVTAQQSALRYGS